MRTAPTGHNASWKLEWPATPPSIGDWHYRAMARTKIGLAELREMGHVWPPHRRIDARSGVAADGTVDLAAVIASLDSTRAFHQREQDAMYAQGARRSTSSPIGARRSRWRSTTASRRSAR